jgi:hypothetical protein
VRIIIGNVYVEMDFGMSEYGYVVYSNEKGMLGNFRRNWNLLGIY